MGTMWRIILGLWSTLAILESRGLLGTFAEVPRRCLQPEQYGNILHGGKSAKNSIGIVRGQHVDSSTT